MDLELRSVTDGGAFRFRWPTQEEEFTRSWQGTIAADGRSGRFVHALGARDVYGTHRPHTVTFIDGAPVVEGVAADDFERSGALLSLIKPWRGHALAKDPADVPSTYSGLEVVDHRAEIDAPYSKRCLALKIRVDDLEAWARAAWARKLARGD
mgnify:CR=1 FL=1